MKKKNAFTLAEVLITLGVIGIVAAMTLPTVINNYTKKLTSKKVSRFYSLMNNAINSVSSEEGNTFWIDEYPYKSDKDSREFYDQYLDKKIISIKNLTGMVIIL